MNSEPNTEANGTYPGIGWTEGVLSTMAATGAGLCCVGPLLLGTLGLSGVAGALASMPFMYHVVLQWIAVAIMVGAWAWFLYKWFQLPDDRRWNLASVVTGIILVGISWYVLQSWAGHVLI